jgi:hypothetical protein
MWGLSISVGGNLIKIQNPKLKGLLLAAVAPGSRFRVLGSQVKMVQGSGFKGSKVLVSNYTLLSFDIASDLDLLLVNL